MNSGLAPPMSQSPLISAKAGMTGSPFPIVVCRVPKECPGSKARAKVRLFALPSGTELGRAAGVTISLEADNELTVVRPSLARLPASHLLGAPLEAQQVLCPS